MKEQSVQAGILRRVSRYAVSVGRRLAALTDKTDYQLNLVHSILEKQQEEINELKAQIEDSPTQVRAIDYVRLLGYLKGSGWNTPENLIKPISTSYGTLGG